MKELSLFTGMGGGIYGSLILGFGVKLRDVPFDKVMLPTPQAADATTGRIIGKNDKFVKLKSGTFRKINQNGTNGSLGLTRTLMFTIPTPLSTENRGAGRKRYRGSKNYRGAKASEALRTSFNDPIYLNPYFGEWMMNYPIGASNLKPLVTDKTQ